jgi:hypothetical protein
VRRALLSATLACVGLWAAALALRGATETRGADEHLRALVAPSQRAEFRVAALSISGVSSEEEQLLYVQLDDQWRCESAYGAICLTSQVEALVDDLAGAWGEPVADSSRAAAFGIGLERPLIVRLFGSDPEAAPLLEVELGASLPGLGEGRGFARLAGSEELLELDCNPRTRLVSEQERRLPPLLDERLLAGEWPSRGAGISRAFIDHTDGRSLDVQSRVTGAPLEPGAPAPREWMALEGETRARCLPYRIGAWQSYLYHLAYRGLSDPTAANRRGLDQPQATLTLIQIDSEPIELLIGRSAPSGATFVLNKKTNLLCLLDREEVDLLLATVEMLCSMDRENPWEEWLPR